MEGAIIKTANLMRSSPTLSLPHASLKQANAELLDAIKHTLQNPRDTMNGLVDERTEYEITSKLFFLPNAPSSTAASRIEYMAEAVRHVQQSLGIHRIDLLIMSFPDIVLDADDDTDEFSEAELEPILEVYRAAVTRFVQTDTVGGLGVAEFSAVKLRQLCRRLTTPSSDGGGDASNGEKTGTTGTIPAVNQINLKDCCVTPRDLIVYAKEMGIKLFTHGDARDMLPTESLHRVLHQDSSDPSAGNTHPPRGDDDHGSDTEGRRPKWVCKYTAVASTRGVVENKGYIVALADE